ncbi:MAG: hypothetical protein ACLPPF_22515 [Rhodomicrobium sp.]
MSDDQQKPAKGLPFGPRGESVPLSCGLAVEAVQSVVPIEALERLCSSFQRSARRWEIIVYPSIVAVIAMMAGAFFFIYSITRDMRDMALQIQPEIGVNINKVAESVSQLSTSLDRMSRNVDTMRTRMETMSADMNWMSKQMVYMKNLDTMTQQMTQMNTSMNAMNAQADAMRWNMQSMNRSIGRPMSMFNSFMPW